MMNAKRIDSVVVGILFSLALYGQQEEVKVVKPYTPTLSGAEKIQLMPRVGDSISYDQPDFNYTIYSKRYETDYRVMPIKPAKMVKPALDKLYKSELKLGAGNYLTPLAELRIHQVRSSKGTAGFHFRHHSMNGKLKINDSDLEAGFNENQLQFYGKRFRKRANIEYGAGLDYNSYIHYGVDTAFTDTVTEDNMTHPYLGGHAVFGIKSAHPDSSHVNYKGIVRYDFFSHNLEQMEHGAVTDFNLEQKFRDFRIGGDAGLSYYGHPGGWDTLFTNQFIIKLNPYISRQSSEWRFMAGINTYTEIRDGQVTPRFYVRGKFSFNIVKEVLVPYLGIDGYQESNNYRKIVGENPYILPNLSIAPTSHRFIVYGGLKGKITDNLAWNIRGSYSSVDNQYFFATDTSDILQNQFAVIYDDMTVANVYAELNIAPLSSLNIFLKGNYFNYDLSREAHAWYRPDFDASLKARYNLGDKILMDAGLHLIGPRYYPALEEGGEPGLLATTLDLNLGAEYRYTKLLSFWMKFNNITAQPYYAWYNYPSYRFRFMAGFTYAL